MPHIAILLFVRLDVVEVTLRDVQAQFISPAHRLLAYGGKGVLPLSNVFAPTSGKRKYLSSMTISVSVETMFGQNRMNSVQTRLYYGRKFP